MYKCVCGYKTSSKYSMESHLMNCNTAKNHYSNNNGSDLIDDVITAGIALSMFDSCCDIFSDSSSSSGFDGFGGGDFGGGGASGDW